MIYPKFIKKGDTIGITALSNGVTEKEELTRLNLARENLQKAGFHTIETKNVRTSDKGRSSSGKERARQLEELYQNSNVSIIIGATGGDFLLEMLSDLNWDLIQQNPKWLQGYSDLTGLLFIITTNFHIATIYGNTIKTFGMKEWHISLKNNLKILQGENLIQTSFPMYEKESLPVVIGNEGYHFDTKVEWKCKNNPKIEMQGRFIGGCIDLLAELFGTKWDHVCDFIETYKEDGIIWYFDNAELTSEQLIRTFWKFKQHGWFQFTKGILFGRNMIEKSYYEISYEEAILSSLSDLEVPIIYESDFGHLPPRMTLINGAYATICYQNGNGSISFEFKE